MCRLALLDLARGGIGRIVGQARKCRSLHLTFCWEEARVLLGLSRHAPNLASEWLRDVFSAHGDPLSKAP
jgi:hypothetical protein